MNVTSLLLLLVFVAAGYVLQPMLMPGLGLDSPSKKEVKVAEKSNAEVAEILPGAVDGVDLSKVGPEDFPEKVTLLRDVLIKVSGISQAVKIDAGTDVEPLALAGTELTIQAPGLAEPGVTHVDMTNFRLRVKPILERKDYAVSPPEPEVSEESGEASDQTEITDVSVPMDTPEVTEDPSDPAPPANNDTEFEEEPVDELKLDEAQLVEAMKRSAMNGTWREIKGEQLKEWKMDEEEKIDGKTYQVGTAEYVAETIFGNRKQPVKALFLQGALKKWVWVNTGEEVR